MSTPEICENPLATSLPFYLDMFPLPSLFTWNTYLVLTIFLSDGFFISFYVPKSIINLNSDSEASIHLCESVLNFASWNEDGSLILSICGSITAKECSLWASWGSMIFSASQLDASNQIPDCFRFVRGQRLRIACPLGIRAVRLVSTVVQRKWSVV